MYQGQGSSEVKLRDIVVFIIWVSFETLKSDWNQS